MTDQQKEPYTKGEKKYTIEFDREACIGAAACCAVSPENWVMNQDGKPDLIYTEIGEDRLKENIEAAEVCPVRVIKLKEKKT
ncbi:MAG: ferredoxin, partial [Nanoarchaeota archaeon]